MKIQPSDVKIKKEREEGNKGTYVIEPLPQGYANTLGNSLRRVLLSSLPGASLSQVKFAGVPHQFTAIKGVKEDVVDLCLNLKKVRIKLHTDNPVVLKLSKVGPCAITAADFEVSSEANIINKSQHIATLSDKSSKLELEAVAEVGTGYVPAEEKESTKIGVILLDSIFSPVTIVSYNIEPTRVGRDTNLDKLVIHIETDGTITPFESLLKASDILSAFFKRLSLGEEEIVKTEVAADGSKDAKQDKGEEVYLEELPLPTRTVNALKKAGIKTLSDLNNLKAEELTEVKNLGEKSIEEIKKLLQNNGNYEA